jgi:hypothetical protein
LDAKLRILLKSYDRIGFGRRGVLDAEREIRRLASELPTGDRARFHHVILSWIEAVNAERVSASLHYNLPEHVQALAIRLCASIPIPDSLHLLRQLQTDRVFEKEEERLCRDALSESITILDADGNL